MKTLTTKKAITLAALALTPVLALSSTSPVQAAPAFRAPVSQRGNNNNVPAWNSNSRGSTAAWNNSRQQAPRYDARPNSTRIQNTRNDQRFDTRRDNDRGRNKSKSGGNDTTKIIGAGIVGGIVGAILGAVLSR